MLHEFFEYLLIAFISSAALIFLSKVVMQAVLRRPAGYYRDKELLQEELMLNSAGISITEELETNPEGEVTPEHIHVQPKIAGGPFAGIQLTEKMKIPKVYIVTDIKRAKRLLEEETDDE